MTNNAAKPDDLQLFHYGIKGMKWGVTRKEGPDGTVSSNPRVKKQQEKREAKRAARKQEAQEAWKKPTTEDSRTASENRGRIKKHGTDALTNKDLQSLVTRMNLEQQYTQLQESGKAQSARKAGRDYISDILKDAGKEFATEGLKWAATQGVKYAFNKATSGNSGPVPTTAYQIPTNLIESGRRRIGR